MRAPTELEWLGFELALSRYFFGSGQFRVAKVLAQLVRRAGTACAAEWLLGAEPPGETLAVYISLLRSAMEDVGFAPVIQTLPNRRYSIARADADAIWQRVMTVVFHLEEAA